MPFTRIVIDALPTVTRKRRPRKLWLPESGVSVLFTISLSFALRRHT